MLYLLNKKKRAILAEETRASQMSSASQEAVRQFKPKKELAQALVDRNAWAMFTLMISLCLLVALVALYVQNGRLANHIKIAFVKLDPSGSTQLSFYDEASQPIYFMNTVHALLTSYVERRYSKVNYSITADYGFVINFMSPALKRYFLENYKAAKVAADFINCRECQQLQVKVRAIQNNESDAIILHGKPGVIYRSTVFVRATVFNSDGSEINKANQIITLVWRIRDASSLPNHLSAIQANPIGIEILSESLREDPTPVTELKHG